VDEINQKFLRGIQMLHGAVFSKSAPLAAGGKKTLALFIKMY